MRKVYRTKGESLPKKMLGAWVPATNVMQRQLHPHSQRSSKQISDEATFKEWFPIAADEAKWNSLIENHFQKLCAEDLRADDPQNYEYEPFDRFDVTQE